MYRKIVGALLLTFFTLTLTAQNNQNRRYTLTIQDSTSIDVQTKEKLKAAFAKVYPNFAVADGYRTKREATLTFSADPSLTIKGKAGEINVNPKWAKNKSQDKIEKELWESFTHNWSSYSEDKKNGYHLTFISKDPNLDPVVRKKLIDTYFKVYPTLVDTYNKLATKDVLFVVDTAYKAVAEASGRRILFSADYLKKNPTDIDVVTHETMHIAQGYGYGAGPVWLTEGIADYARYKYGVDNVGSKWSLPAFLPTHNYKNSYRITARFFVWVENKVKEGTIFQIDQLLRKKEYKESTWKDLTGKSIDELWDDYAKNPNIS